MLYFPGKNTEYDKGEETKQTTTPPPAPKNKKSTQKTFDLC